jgi:C_GCAxxG_C_C family probable redox protein
VTNPVDIAVERFDGPYSCSQAVFSAFAPQYGLTDELAVKISAPFGGGMSRQGNVCGAVSGALMVIGLARGSVDPKDKQLVYRLGEEFIQRFESGHTSVLCRDLLGFDLSDPVQVQAARDQGVSTRLCPAFVRNAAEILTELLARTQGE